MNGRDRIFRNDLDGFGSYGGKSLALTEQNGDGDGRVILVASQLSRKVGISRQLGNDLTRWGISRTWFGETHTSDNDIVKSQVHLLFIVIVAVLRFEMTP